MDNDDKSLFTLTPNHFLLSTYKENLSENMNQEKLNDNMKIIYSYKCYLCRKILENPILTCSNCVNTGQFCSSKHEGCLNERRDMLSYLLNKNDYEDFEEHLKKKSNYLQCCDQMFLLNKFNSEKTILQSEFQIKLISSTKTRQMSQEIQIRKNRLKLVNHSIQKLREQIEQKEQINIEIQERINDTHSRIKSIKTALNQIKQDFQSSNDEKRKKIDYRAKNDKNLQNIRRERFNELMKYLFPIQRVSADKDLHAKIAEAILNAQYTTIDDTNNEQVENEDLANGTDDRYQIVNSFLSSDGDYQIHSLVSIYNVDRNINESDGNASNSDSPQLSPSYGTYEVLSALSHACQVINIIAFYLHINLPFRLHHYEFNTDNLILDCFRAAIAKLNTNIISTCLSQGIEFTKTTYTLENLLKLLTFQRYPRRPIPITYSQNYIDMLEREVNENSRTLKTAYWFDDDHKEEKDVTTDILNSYEWESIPHELGDYIWDEQSIYEQSDSSSSTPPQQGSSIMSSSLDFFKKTFWNS